MIMMALLLPAYMGRQQHWQKSCHQVCVPRLALLFTHLSEEMIVIASQGSGAGVPGQAAAAYETALSYRNAYWLAVAKLREGRML